MSIKETYDRFKHLDSIFCEVTEEDSAKDKMLRDLWLAIKEHVEQPERYFDGMDVWREQRGKENPEK